MSEWCVVGGKRVLVVVKRVRARFSHGDGLRVLPLHDLEQLLIHRLQERQVSMPRQQQFCVNVVVPIERLVDEVVRQHPGATGEGGGDGTPVPSEGLLNGRVVKEFVPRGCDLRGARELVEGEIQSIIVACLIDPWLTPELAMILG